MRGRILFFCLLGIFSSVEAQQFGETVRIFQPYDDDLYAAARIVELRAPIGGDAVLAGQTVAVDAPVAQDVIAAGEFVGIDAQVGDDLRAAGRNVRVNAGVSGHVIAAADSLVIGQRGEIGGFAWLAGRDIVVMGNIGGELKAAGESVRIAGRISGDAQITAERLELLPGARIDGNLIWRGRDKPRIDQTAVIGGRLIERPLPPERHRGPQLGRWIGALLILSFIITGVVLYLLFPGVAQQAAMAIRRLPGLGALLGFAVLMVTPFLILLLFVTGIGGLLAFILFALYIVAIPISSLLGIYVLTDLALARIRSGEHGRAVRGVAYALAILLVAIAQGVPLLGFLLGFLLLIWGFGAIGLLLHRAVGRQVRAPV